MSGKVVFARALCYFVLLGLLPVKCTIDISKSEFSYIADHLSKTDCRRLIASLQYTSYELPSNLSDAVKKVPKHVPCIQLLLVWNSGDSDAGGKGRSHVDVSHRLRQLNKRKLADWLGNTVFCHLAIDVDKTLDIYPFKAHETVKSTDSKHPINDIVCSDDDWTAYDTILWTGIIAGVSLAMCQVIRACINKRRRRNYQCELQDLLIRENFDSDDDYASENMFFNSIEHFDED